MWWDMHRQITHSAGKEGIKSENIGWRVDIHNDLGTHVDTLVSDRRIWDKEVGINALTQQYKRCRIYLRDADHLLWRFRCGADNFRSTQCPLGLLFKAV